MRHFLFIFFLLIISSFESAAQYVNPCVRYTTYGISLKASYFDGDVKTSLKYVRPGIGFSINRRISPRVTLFSELMWLRVMGDDFSASNPQNPVTSGAYIRNLNFRNDIKQLSAGLKYDLIPVNEHYKKRPIFNIYGSIALAVLYHNPKAKLFKDSTNTKSRWLALQSLRTENVSYSSFQFSIPLAIGIRYKLSLQWDLELELAYNYVFSDYIDDVSGKNVDPSQLDNPNAAQLANRSAESVSVLTGKDRELDYIQNQLERPIVSNNGYSFIQGFGPGASRGSKRGNDAIAIFSVRLLYAFPGKVNCPKFRELQ